MVSWLERVKDSKYVWYGLSTAMILILIYFADYQKFIDAVRSVKPVSMAIAFIFGISVFLVFGYIWHSFFRNLEISSGLYKSYKMFMGGHFMNSITPLGQLGGEPFMAYVVSKNTDSSYEKSLSAVVSSDIVIAIPVMTYTTAGVIYLLMFNNFSSFTQQVFYLMLTGLAVLGLLVYLLWFDRNKLVGAIFGLFDVVQTKFGLSQDFFGSLRDRIRSIKSALDEVGRDPLHLAKVSIISHLYLVAQFFCLYFILKGLGVQPSILRIYFTVILAGLAIFSPTPGGSGTFEAAFTGLLMFFYPEMALNTAVAAAVLFRLTTYWPGIVIGYFCLLKLRKTREAKEKARRD